jgi:copper transport protein
MEPLDRVELLTGLSHAATLGATVLVAGLAAFVLFVWLPVCRPAFTGREATKPFVLLTWALFGVLALAGLLETSLYAVKASGEPWSPSLLWQAFSETRVGSIWLARLVFAFVAALSVSFASRSDGSSYWWAATALACVPLLTLTQLSHAAAEGRPLPFVADWAHVAAAAAWMGGVLSFPMLLLGPLKKASAQTRAELLRRSVPRFSRMATLAVVVLVVTGSYAGLQHVPSPESLGATPYGRALILKLFLVFVMLVIGAMNLIDRGRNESFGHLVGFELALAAGVFVATGFLTTLPPADAMVP